MIDTVLDQIVKGIKSRLQQLDDEDGRKLFNHVIDGTPDYTQPLMWPCVGLDQGKEETERMMDPFVDKHCTFFLEFCFARMVDVDPYAKFRYYHAQMQKALFGDYEDLTLGGLAIEVFEVSCTPQIEGLTDNAPGGLMQIMVRYRHRRGNPYKQE